MQLPGILVDESERLATLYSLGILDTPPEEGFDRIVSHACELLGMPIAVVSLVDADRQWFKAKVGTEVVQTPRDVSMCGHTITSDAPLIVPDTWSDARFHDNALVRGPEQIRFYAGHPLMVAGRRVGAVCVMDREPRAFDARAQATLRVLAYWAEAELVRRLVTELPSASLVQEQRLDALVAALPDIVFRLDARGILRAFHGGSWLPLADRPAYTLGMSLAELLPPPIAAEHLRLIALTIETGAQQTYRHPLDVQGRRRQFDVRFSRVHTNEVLMVVRDVTEETETAEALRRSEALFRQTSELTSTGGWSVDLVSQKTEWSEQMYRNLELDPSEGPESADTFRARMEPEFRARMTHLWTEAARVGGHADIEVAVRTARGSRRWMRIVGAAQREGDEMVRLYGACQDITQRKEAALESERRETQLRLLGDDLPDAGLFQLETGGESGARFTYLSSSLESLLGVSMADGTCDPVSLLQRLEGSDRRRLLVLGAASREAVSPLDAELRFTTPLGVRWLHVRCVPRLTPDGRCRWDGLVLDQTRRREAERNERLRSQKLAAVLQTAGDATFVIAGEIVEFANPAAEVMFGAQAGGLEGRRLDGLLPGWSPVRDASHPPRELSARKLTGLCFPVTCTTAALDADDRQVVVVRDQSETRWLEHRLEERGTLLSEMQRLAGIGAWKVDLRTGKLLLDEEFHRIHGTSADSETQDADVRMRVHPDERELMDSLMAEAIVRRGPVEKEFRIVRADGLRHVLTRAEMVYGDEGMPVVFRGFSQDVTERRRMEDERRRLLDERERLAQILDATPDIVSMADLEGRVLYVNRAGRHLGNLAPDANVEQLGLTVRACHPGGAWRHIESVAIPSALRDGVWVGESVLRSATGVGIPVAQTILAHRSSDGTIERISTIARDIRGQKRNERALAAARLRAEEANRAKSAFLANMSHELRTPLNAIIGFSDLLAQQIFGTLNPRQADYVGHIVAGGRHLLSLVDDILDISKVEAGRLTLDLVETAIGPLLVSVCSGMQPVAARGGLALDVVIAPDLPSLRLDVKRVRQILINLLSNACKFTAHGGRVSVEAAVADGDMTVRVSDTGIGIGREDLQRVFDEFEQIASSGGRPMDGTGLGLALSRRLADLHGGRLDVESEIGEGSTFTLRLPVKSLLAPPPIRALLVGHVPIVAAQLVEQLEQAGLHVDVVPGIDTALTRLEGRPPGVLILDAALRTGLDEQSPLLEAASRLELPVMFLGGVASVAEEDAVPPARWMTLARLRASAVPLPLMAGLRVWVFDIDQTLAALESLLRGGGATVRRGSSLSGAVAFDADLIVYSNAVEALEQPLHPTLPAVLIPPDLPVEEVAARAYRAMAGSVTPV
ncbi:MAG: PAS domain S-box protein [Myxococcota bacterium]